VPVLSFEPALLTAGAAVLEAAIADVAGNPVLLRFDGAWPERVPDDARAFLAAVPALTVAVGEAPAAIQSAFDVVFEATEDAQVAATTFLRAPHAACAAALLVRSPPVDVWNGLFAESATYSMLQSGPEFRAWRDARGTPPPAEPDDAGPRVRVRHAGPLTEIVLTRPARRNALDVRMRDELHAALTDELGRAGPIVVRGDGSSFSEGGDLDEFGTFPDPVLAHTIRLGRSLAWRFAQLAPRLVVGLHGAAVGSGIELPAFARHVVAADHTRIALPELGLGLIPGAGGTVSVPARCGRQRLLALLLRGSTIPASTARDWGLVDEVVPRAGLETRLLEIAESIVT
jgi:enoyl-CoA hydratase/carnithine racemase